MKGIKNLKIMKEIKNLKIGEKLDSSKCAKIIALGGYCLLFSAMISCAAEKTEAPRTSTTVTADKPKFTKPSSINSNLTRKIAKDYLKTYIEQRDRLEEEIDRLLEQKEQLQSDQTFNIKDLIVMEYTNIDNKSNLYILVSNGAIFYTEYHGVFDAEWHSINDTNISKRAIYFTEYQPLFNYLTDKEIETLSENNGEVTTSELDEILARIRKEDYHQQLQKNNHSLKLTNN